MTGEKLGSVAVVVEDGAAVPHLAGVPVGLLIDGGEPPVLGIVGIPAPGDHAERGRETVDAEGPPGVGGAGPWRALLIGSLLR